MKPASSGVSHGGLASIQSPWRRSCLGLLGLTVQLALMVALCDGGAQILRDGRWSLSLGASLLLVFFVPESPAAQPGRVIVGHLSACACALAVVQAAPRAPALVLAALVVPLAALAMIVMQSLHPPAGAAALMIALDEARPMPPRQLQVLFFALLVMLAVRRALDWLIDCARCGH